MIPNMYNINKKVKIVCKNNLNLMDKANNCQKLYHFKIPILYINRNYKHLIHFNKNNYHMQTSQFKLLEVKKALLYKNQNLVAD